MSDHETIFLGLDLGTTGLKVSLLDDGGRLIGSRHEEHPIHSPQPGYAEQAPHAWWDGFVTCCRALAEQHPREFANIVGIGLCGQMHTQVYLDGQGRVLRPAITWMDQRTTEIVEAINGDETARALVFQETSNFATTTYTAPQVQWVQENQPEVWKKTAHVLVAKDYIKYRLTGQLVTDDSEASGTLLFDTRKRAWSEPMFDFFSIPRERFPAVAPADEIIGHVNAEAARVTGLRTGTPVANGSSDNSASALGAGMIHAGQVTLIIGTAGVISVCSDRPLPDDQGRTLCWDYCLRDKWITLGITQTAGESLNWFKNAFDRGDTGAPEESGDIFEEYNQAVAGVADGADGLIFLPYLNGERTPYWDPFARGVFYGVNLSTRKAHFIKAIMEGVSFALRHNIETVESLGITVDQVRAVGGGLRSQAWLDILGKVLGKPIVTVSAPDTANLGNALLCGRALGRFTDLEAAVAEMATTDQAMDFGRPAEIYDQQYGIFLELYERLEGTFKRSAGL